MANINNFSLVGVGSSVKLGKGGITLAQNTGKLTVGGNNVALESFVSSAITDLGLGTMSTQSASDYTTTTALTSLLTSGYQPLDSDLTSIAALSTDGLLRKTGGTWAMDSATYALQSSLDTTNGNIGSMVFTGGVGSVIGSDTTITQALNHLDASVAGLTGSTLGTEVNSIETSLGSIVAGNGTWNGFSGTHYLDGSPDVAGAFVAVDNELDTLSTQVAGLAGLGALSFQGTVNGNEVDTTSVTPTPATGYVYRVTTTAATDWAGTGIEVNVGDYVVKTASGWLKFDNTDPTVVGTSGRIAVSGGTHEGFTVDLATVGTAGTYIGFTVDAYGRVTGFTSPTTLAGYGIANGVSTTTTFGGDVSGTYNAISLNDVGTPVSAAFVKFTTDAKGRVTATTAVLDSDIIASLGYTPVDAAGTVAMTGNLDMGTHTIVNLVDPTSAQDAATKAYVDSKVASGNHTSVTAFSYTDNGTPVQILASIPSGALVSRVIVKVGTAFVGATGPVVSVERGTQVFDNGAGSDLETTGTYIIDSFTAVSATGALTLTVTAASATAGAGTVFVEYTL